MAPSLSNTLGYLFALHSTWGQRAARVAGLDRTPVRTGQGRRRAFRQALARAYRGFAGAHPRLAESLFDEWFLSRLEGRLFAGLTGAAPLTAAALARAWADQLGPGRAQLRERQIAALLPAAADFLDRLAGEYDEG